MGDYKAFLTIPRKEAGYRPVHDRIQDFGEVEQTLNEGDRRQQASRCMDCGVPFCNWACPLGNRPPEWNDAVYKGDFELAYRLLNATNDFPEFTGRVCPALCEKACVLNLTMHEPTTNRENEAAITEIAWRENYVRPVSPVRNGRKVAVIGGGPAGLAAANQLNRKGEKNEKAGGLLRFGIPNFKLNKTVIDRRIALMEQEGIRFRYGEEVAPETLPKGFDAYVIATGTPTARDLPVPGRELKGVHFALELLAQQNRVGTAHRQGCKSVMQIEIMPKPPVGPDDPANPWPNWPRTLKTSSSHEEGCVRRWNINTIRFLGENGHLTGVEIQPIDWEPNPEGGRPKMVPAGDPEVVKADIVLLAAAAGSGGECLFRGRRLERRFPGGARDGLRPCRLRFCRCVFQ